ncbi:MAG: hypothetical protein WCI55_15010, partial [Armatimonadota bacterium]
LTALTTSSLNPAQQAVVQNLLRTHPDAWREFGNLFEWTRNEALSILHPNTVEYQSTIEGIRQLRQELEQSGDTALERIVIEQIINCHIQTAKTGFQLERVDPKGDSEPLAKHYARVHERAQRRLLRSMQVLTRLRKANLDLELKLRKNRPPYYDKSDYLTVSEEIIRLRQDSLQEEAQATYEQRMIRQRAAREERQSEAKVAQEAKRSSLERAWEQFLAKKKLEAQNKEKQNQAPRQTNSSPNLQTGKPPVSNPPQHHEP